jgi:serine protease AprX
MAPSSHGARPRAAGASEPAAPTLTCPICRRDVPLSAFLTPGALGAEVALLAAANTPGWRPELGLCVACAERFETARDYLHAHFPRLDRHPILPTAVRLGASERYRGRGVTVAFLDAGFYAHPDLVEPVDRILAYVDVTNPRASRRDLARPDESSWHGMMTSVVACGNGRLSGGAYRGLASQARLVLVKCGTARRVVHDDIRRGLEWVVRRRRRYKIRIVNVSVGGDFEASYLSDGLSQEVERCTREGILVCAAVGNLGHLPKHPVLPPASAPSALTVGGLDDKNRLAFAGYDMYHSSYGPTLDGLQKPEVIAPGIWVAAPILPGTATAAQAALLARLDEAPDARLSAMLAESPGVDPELDAEAASGSAARLRALVDQKLRDNNLISGAYKHVDGTSFAAPIVASIAAQLLEANPALSPLQLKRALIDTARRLPQVDVDRQGWGVVDPHGALLMALEARGARPRPKGSAR